MTKVEPPWVRAMTASTDCTWIGDAGENEYEPDTVLEDTVDVLVDEIVELVVTIVVQTVDVALAELQFEVLVAKLVLSDA
jgi:hypothetical protein